VKESSMNFLTDPLDRRLTLRPADVMVCGWEGGKHACVDLTRVRHCWIRGWDFYSWTGSRKNCVK